MSVKKEASGRRSIELTIEVPGTVEEVWQAIATGPGISSWFVPAEFEETDGNPTAVKLAFAPGMESRDAVTAWNPPHMFVREGAGWAPGSPPIATEFRVEAQAGGVCVVRIVQSLFSSTDDWDGQLTGAEEGWPGITRVLRIYLTHFRGQPSAIMKVMAPVAVTAAQAWTTLTDALAIKGAIPGASCIAPTGAPQLSGVVEYASDKPFGLMLRLDQPAPGTAAFGTISFGDTVMIGCTFYLYGEQAAAVVAREQPLWQTWLEELFPMPAQPPTI